MIKKFHINKYGIPSVCHDIFYDCPLGDNAHFDTYEQAQEYLDNLKAEKQGEIEISDPAKKIKSYYQSDEAVNDFYMNKREGSIADFDLIMISWASLNNVKKNMKNNEIGEAKFTYGEIVRILEQHILGTQKNTVNSHLEDRYFNGNSNNAIPHTYYKAEEVWDDFMQAQKDNYSTVLSVLAEDLNVSIIGVMYLPLSARKRLESDGFMVGYESVANIVYKVDLDGSNMLMTYNHETEEKFEYFDSYELAGVIEGKTIYDFVHSKSVDVEFDELWSSGKWRNNIRFSSDYKVQREIYRSSKFMRGLEGPSIPKAFMEMSPIAAKEISKFIRTHKILMKAVSKIMGEYGIEEDYHYQYEDDYGWKIN